MHVYTQANLTFIGNLRSDSKCSFERKKNVKMFFFNLMIYLLTSDAPII